MRLIDADKLQQDLIDRIDWLRKQDYELYCAIGDDITFCIDKEPTAYYMDKVVEQLEDESKKCSICELPTCKEDESHCCYCNGLNKSIEIVKAGGMNNNSKTSD